MTTNFIQYSKNVLSLEECQNIINFYENSKEYHTDGNFGGDNIDYEKKKCCEMFIDGLEINPKNEYFSCLSRSLVKHIQQYRKDYPFLENVFYWDLSSCFKIQKYLPKEAYFLTHCENDGYRNGEMERRMIAWMIYLNDVTDGGETNFPTQRKKFAPRAGDVLLWPAYWTHPHHGIPSPSQIKYIVTGWFSYISDSELNKSK